MASLLIGLSFFVWQFRQTLAARDSLQQELYQSEMLEAQAAWDENNFDRMIELLKRWDPAHRGNSGRDYRDIAWYVLWKLAESTSASQRFDLDDNGVGVAFSASGRSVAICEPTRTLLLDIARKSIRELATHKSARFRGFVDFSADDRWLVCPHEDPASIQIVALLSGTSHRLEQNGVVNEVAFSHDGKWLAAGHSKGVSLWRSATANPDEWMKERAIDVGANVTALAFAIDDKELYLGTSTGRVLRSSLAANDVPPVELFAHDPFQIHAIACSTDLIASAGIDVRLFDRNSRRVIHTIGGQQDEVRGVCFSPDEQSLVLGSRDGSIGIWALAGHALIGQLKGHSGIVECLDAVDLSNGSWKLASVSQDYTMRLWDMPASIRARHLATDEPVIAAVLASDASSLTYATTPPAPGVERDFLGPFPLFGASAKSVFDRIVRFSEYRIRNRDLRTEADHYTISGHDEFNWIILSANETYALGTPDGRVLVGNSTKGVFDEIPFRPPPTTSLEEAMAALSRDGRWIALNHGNGSIIVWNVQARRTECTIRAPTSKVVEAMVFSNEGTAIAFICGDDVCLHDTATGTLLAPRFRHSHRDFVLCLAYSREARRLAIGSFDDTASIWEVDESPTELVVLRGHRASIRGIHLLDDARYVLTVGGDHCTKLWDAITGRTRLTLRNTNWSSTAASDGRTLATLGRRSIQLFRCATPEEVTDSAWWQSHLSKPFIQLGLDAQTSSTGDTP
jgi:WD40 repeat protein